MRNMMLASAMMIALSFTTTAFAAADYLKFAGRDFLQCVHPTTNVDKASAEYVNPPTIRDDITTARIKIFYSGWVKNNSMTVQMDHRKVGPIDQVKVKVLEDTAATGAMSCKFSAGWQDW